MQTFFPVAGAAEASLLYLDERRRRNQINETFVILNTLLSNRTTGWPNHPATLMWEGYVEALASYGLINALMFEGYSRQRQAFSDVLSAAEPHSLVLWPKWTRDDRVALSHRSNLYRKDPPYYASTPAQGYVWPVWRRVKAGGFLLGAAHHNADFRGKIIAVSKAGINLSTVGLVFPSRPVYPNTFLVTWAQVWEPGRYYYEAPLA